MTTQVESLLSFLAAFSVNHASPIVRVWSITSPALLEKKRGTRKADGQFCPYKTVVRKAAGSFQLARESGSYERHVNAELRRQGLDATFEAAGLWVRADGVAMGKAGEVAFTAEHIGSGLVYLIACTPRNGQPTKSVDIWEIDGQVMEGEELEQFKQDWLRDKPKASVKQAEAGLTDPAKQSVVRTYHIENIVMIEHGGIGWSATEGAWGLRDAA